MSTKRKDPSKVTDLDKNGGYAQLELTPREIKQLKYDARKRKWVRRCRLINDYIHAICKLNFWVTFFLVWISLSCLIIYKTNFFRQVWENPKVNSFFLNLSLACAGFVFAIVTYTSVIAPCRLGREVDLEKDLPSLIPAMTLSGVTSFISSIMAMWPVWGIFTPIYMLVLFFGYSFSLMFLPSGHLGTVCFYLATGIGAYISHTMPHDPVWWYQNSNN